jgi:hypothetical protein
VNFGVRNQRKFNDIITISPVSQYKYNFAAVITFYRSMAWLPVGGAPAVGADELPT